MRFIIHASGHGSRHPTATIMSAGVRRYHWQTISKREAHRPSSVPPKPVLKTDSCPRPTPLPPPPPPTFNRSSMPPWRHMRRKTKCKLLSHPIAAQLQSCDDHIAVLSVLQDIIHQFDRRRSSDESLTDWLNPTVNVLYAFSDFVGQGVSLVGLHLTIFIESLIRFELIRYFHLQMWYRHPPVSEYRP